MRSALMLPRLLVAAAILSPAAPRSADPAAVDDLARNAWYWQARAREERAARAWEKVLLADGAHAEALAALGGFEARHGRWEKAREYLDRLRAAGGARRQIESVERSMALGTRFDRLLDDARARVHGGQRAEGIARYRELFGGGEPPGHLALEFYETLGGDEAGWEEARAGLQALARRVPHEQRIQLAAAKLLTYRVETRAEGIAQLEKLASGSVVSDEATAAWRQALLWLSIGRADVAAMRRYLEKHPNDSQVAQRVAQGAERAAQEGRATSIKSGFEALGRGDVRSSEQLFKSIEGSSHDPRALTGLGLVALRDGNFERATALLERAKALAPRSTALWEQPLRSARFWSLVDGARRAREAKREGEAEARLLEAVALSPAERHHAQLALADLYLAQRQRAKAQEQIDPVLASPPKEVGSLVALVHLLVQSGRGDDALRVNELVEQAEPSKALRREWVASEQRRRAAQASVEAGDLERARSELVVAMRQDPQNAWVQHDLVNVYLASGDVASAHELADRLVTERPDMHEARVAQARVLAAQGETSQALSRLSSVPARALDADVALFRQQLETQADADRVIADASHGKRDSARADLLRLQRRIEGEPSLESVVAMAWASLGEHDRAVPLARGAVERTSRPPAALRLRYAVVLLRAGEERDLQLLLRELNNDPALSRSERQGVDDLRVAAAVRNADRARKEGSLVVALGQLTPLLGEFPENPRLLCALGRVFWSGEQYANAYATFMKVLQRDPGDFEARQGAIEAVQSQGDVLEARRLANEGIEHSPDEARAYLVAGRMAERDGRDGDAMQLYARALALSEGEPKLPAWASLRVADASTELTPTSSTAAILREASRRFAVGPAARTSEKALGLQAEIRSAMESVRSRHRFSLGASLDVRRRDGEDGLGGLTELRNVAEASAPIAYRGRLYFHAVPTELDGGTLALGIAQTAQQFGSGVQLVDAPSRQQVAAGVELRLGYAERLFEIDGGTAPLGFAVQNFTGGLKLRHTVGSFSISAEAARRSVTESLLSYAGMKDPLTGRTWGGVVRDHGRLDLASVNPSSTYYVFASYGRLTGSGVATNYNYVVGAGAKLKPYQWSTGAFITGIAASGMHYDKNLRYFTFGHGGYFSPQQFVHAGVPLRIEVDREARLQWHAGVEPGLNWHREQAAPYFPLDPELQAARQGASDATGAPLAAFYPAHTVVGFAFDADAGLAYRISDRLTGRVGFDYHRAPDYQEIRAGLFLNLALTSGAEAP